MGEFITIIAVGLVALLAVLLVTPMRFRLHLATVPQLSYRVDMQLAGGAVPGFTIAKGPQSRRKAKPAKRSRPSRRPRLRGSVGRALPGLAADILRRIHVTELHVDADYGLDDPAATGQLSGLLMPFQYATPLPTQVTLDLRPDFTQSRLQGSLTLALKLTIAAFFVPAFKFVWRAFGPGQ